MAASRGHGGGRHRPPGGSTMLPLRPSGRTPSCAHVMCGRGRSESAERQFGTCRSGWRPPWGPVFSGRISPFKSGSVGREEAARAIDAALLRRTVIAEASLRTGENADRLLARRLALLRVLAFTGASAFLKLLWRVAT